MGTGASINLNGVEIEEEAGGLNTPSMWALGADALKEGTVGYRGETVDGVKEGRGVFIYDNGDMYKGFWRQNKKDGKGYYRYIVFHPSPPVTTLPPRNPTQHRTPRNRPNLLTPHFFSHCHHATQHNTTHCETDLI